MSELAPLVDVITHQFQQSSYCKPGHGRWKISLKCGHTLYPKHSTRVGKRARCFWCAREKS